MSSSSSSSPSRIRRVIPSVTRSPLFSLSLLFDLMVAAAILLNTSEPSAASIVIPGCRFCAILRPMATFIGSSSLSVSLTSSTSDALAFASTRLLSSLASAARLAAPISACSYNSSSALLAALVCCRPVTAPIAPPVRADSPPVNATCPPRISSCKPVSTRVCSCANA